jgi:hypothetical protein
VKFKLFVLATALLFAAACSTQSEKMADAQEQQLVAPSDNQAQIVFLRSSFVGSLIQAVVYDATDGGAKFIGILSNGKKLAYTVDPGPHTFMVVSEAADFLAANLEGGKTYYAMATPRMGAWKARFSLYPVRNGGPGEFQYQSGEFQKWLKESSFVENTPASQAWADENRSSVLKKQADYWQVWQTKSPSELAERTLNEADGVE